MDLHRLRTDGPADGSGPRPPSRRVLANERLTATTGVVLFLLFAAEGATILLRVGRTLPAHVFIGMLLIPPVLLKLCTTGHRFARYYLGDPEFVDRGPPMWALRLVGPFVVLTSVAVLATGVADALMDPRPAWIALGHKVAFVLWFGCMTLHVLGHLRETPVQASADWRRGRAVPGRATRLAVVAGSVALGAVLGIWSLGWTVHA